METNEYYNPCKKCREKLLMGKKLSVEYGKKIQVSLKLLRNTYNFEIGSHGAEKAALKFIDLHDSAEREIASSGKVIEIQKGKFHNEFKLILRTKRNEEILHYVFLKDAYSNTLKLINVYCPSEGMNYKWSKDGMNRIYLNTFRSCCPHPLDVEENHHKAHHGVQHGLYDYQKAALNNNSAVY